MTVSIAIAGTASSNVAEAKRNLPGTEITLIYLKSHADQRLVNVGRNTLGCVGMPHRITRACTKCSACLSECPTEAILEGKTQFYIDTDVCLDHKACVAVCPVKAIEPVPANEGTAS